MTSGERAAAAALLVALAAGCSSSDEPMDTLRSSSPAVPTTALPHRPGLLGAIDSARLVAVCTNVRLASTALEGGLSGSVAAVLDGVIAALREPPQNEATRAAAAHWRTVRARAGDEATVRRLTAFCDREGG